MKEIDYNQLGKILSGEATPEEQKQFNKWLKQSEENQEIYNAYRDFCDNVTITEYQLRHSAAEKKSKQIPQLKTSSYNRWHFWVAAASVIVIATFSVFFFMDKYNPLSESRQAQNNIVLKSNPRGQKSKILLPDGSVVWLNSSSSIEYAESFSDTLRGVNLTGEAYFEVAEDSLKPFVVTTGALQATVLGTTFNIDNYSENELATVSLASGKLMITQQNNKEILLPGNQVKLKKSNNRLIKENIDIKKIAVWKDGILIFDQENIQYVVARLERWYDVKISISGDVSPDWKFTGYFDNEYLENVLEVLCYGKNLDYKIDGKKVKLIRQ